MTTTPDGEVTTTSEETARGCPVIDFDFTVERPALEYFTFLDGLREEAPIAWNTYGGGFWMLNRNALVGEAFQTPEVFSSSATVPPHPHPPNHLKPTQVDRAGHPEYRPGGNPPV
jgi:hypothetical protein